ncbi:MAG: hypothetical protein KF862_08130 [Chitinophagaceae bacterium]|nr:hypothetical protein [Chitinophagaceae bacterium]
MKLAWRRGRGSDMHCNEITLTDAGVQHMAIHIPERELLILLKIVGNDNGADIVNFNEIGEGHTGIGYPVFLKMLHHEGYLQELMKLRKRQHVDGNK